MKFFILFFVAWEQVSQPYLSSHRITHATLYDSLSDKIYMIGGTSEFSDTFVNLNYRYDPLSDSWEYLSPMPKPVGWIQGAFYQGKIYIFGGLSNHPVYYPYDAQELVQIYDIPTDNWYLGNPSPSPFFAHGTYVYNGNAYIIGGIDHNGKPISYVLRYDIINNSWSIAGWLPDSFFMGGVTGNKNNIYLVGGYNGHYAYSSVYQGTIDELNPDDIIWNVLCFLPYPVFNNSACFMKDKIFLLGGFVGTTAVDSFYAYDLNSNTWRRLPSYPVPITRNHFMVARKITGEVFVMAGDSYGDGYIPNNYYYKIQAVKVKEVERKIRQDLEPKLRNSLFDITGRRVFKLKSRIGFKIKGREDVKKIIVIK